MPAPPPIPEKMSIDAVTSRIDQILANEAGTTATADPLGGSFYVEALTDELEARAWELIERIDEIGGAVQALPMYTHARLGPARSLLRTRGIFILRSCKPSRSCGAASVLDQACHGSALS